MQIRRAAATAREALLDQAAKKLGVARRPARGRTTGCHLAVGRHEGLTYAAAARRPRVHHQGRSRGAAEGPEGLQDRRHRRCLASTFPQDHRARSPSCRISSCPACCMRRMVHPPAVGRNARSVERRRLSRRSPVIVRAVRKGDFLAVVATNEWAAIRASTTNQGDLVRIGTVCPTRPSSSNTCVDQRWTGMK